VSLAAPADWASVEGRSWLRPTVRATLPRVSSSLPVSPIAPRHFPVRALAEARWTLVVPA